MSKGPSYPIEAYKAPGLAIIAGTFQQNGVSAPDVLIGGGWTVARTDVGKYTVTFSDTFKRLVSFVATIGETGANQDFTAHYEEVARTGTCSSVIVHTRLGANDADTDNQQVSFIAVLGTSNTLLERAS